MAIERDPYDVLGVTPSQTWAEIRLAYRSLARRYHADGSTPNRDCMVELNAAYATLEREHQRMAAAAEAAAERKPPVAVPVAPVAVPIATDPGGPAVPPPGSLYGRIRAARHVDTPIVDFGQYAGWRIAEIAETDPRYLRWLSRHSSGHRYRAAIEQVLGPDPEVGRRAALVS